MKKSPSRKNANKEGKEFEDMLTAQFNKYRADSFIFQREKEPSTTLGKTTEYFLPLKYDIPFQKLVSPKEYQKLVADFNIVGNPYDFNNIYNLGNNNISQNNQVSSRYRKFLLTLQVNDIIFILYSRNGRIQDIEEGGDFNV